MYSYKIRWFLRILKKRKFEKENLSYYILIFKLFFFKQTTTENMPCILRIVMMKMTKILKRKRIDLRLSI